MKLFMVYLGGMAPGANIELHDVQFVIGKSIEDTYPLLIEHWYGSPRGLHLDSYKELKGADGFEIELKEFPQNSELKLFFVNAGGYQRETLAEQHAFGLFVGKSETEVKNRALNTLLKDSMQQHKDDLFLVENHLLRTPGQKYFIHLKPSTNTFDLNPDWFGYRVIGE